MSTELALHRMPMAGDLWVCTGDLPTPKKTSHEVSQGSYTSSHAEKTWLEREDGQRRCGGRAVGRGDPTWHRAMDSVTRLSLPGRS